MAIIVPESGFEFQLLFGSKVGFPIPFAPIKAN
jgi:hypothetical protein